MIVAPRPERAMHAVDVRVEENRIADAESLDVLAACRLADAEQPDRQVAQPHGLRLRRRLAPRLGRRRYDRRLLDDPADFREPCRRDHLRARYLPGTSRRFCGRYGS